MGSSLYNGIKNRDVISTSGTRQMGIETMPPLITRGVLIDVAEFEQVDHLEAGYAIQPAELDETLAAQRARLGPGTQYLCVQVGVGFGRYRRTSCLVSQGSVKRVRNGQLNTKLFAGVAINLPLIRYRSKQKGKFYQCILKC